MGYFREEESGGAASPTVALAIRAACIFFARMRLAARCFSRRSARFVRHSSNDSRGWLISAITLAVPAAMMHYDCNAQHRAGAHQKVRDDEDPVVNQEAVDGEPQR